MENAQTLKSKRLKLWYILKTICDEVHYQPPSDVKLNYPCIVYNLSNMEDIHANNQPYLRDYTFTATLMIDDDLDSELVEKFIEAATKFKNTIPVDGLNNIYCEFTL